MFWRLAGLAAYNDAVTRKHVESLKRLPEKIFFGFPRLISIIEQNCTTQIIVDGKLRFIFPCK